MNIKIVPKTEYPVDKTAVKHIASSLNINQQLAQILYMRGFCDETAVCNFLYPNEKSFYDPFLMKGMDKAVERIKSAIENDEKIIVYGDYDADGICASAILSLFLSSRGLDVLVHIPNRIGDGYGLNVETLSRLIENEMPDLILTCDCGISGAKEVEFALDLGVDVIVTDHHEISGDIPECIVVNPKQKDCSYPYNMLCGAGVALKLVEALSDRNTMLDYIDLACVATIADLVPLLDENRLIVQIGLKRLNARKNMGLNQLFNMLNIDEVTSGDVAYKIAPRINAAGRMGDAYRAFELLTLKDKAKIIQIADEIEKDNGKRKEICDEMYDEAVGDLAFEDKVNSRAIILSHPDWEKGITGIVAARIAGDFKRPTFILVRSGDAYKGTCRSVDGINIHELLWYCREYLVEFGGHAQAAGFSILPQNIELFKQKVNEYLSEYSDEYFLPTVEYDIEIDDKQATVDFVSSLGLLEPFGNGNPKPLFKMSFENAKVSPCKNNQNHISVILNSGMQFFAFNYSKLSYQLVSQGKKEIVVELQLSNFGGKSVKGMIKCVSPENLFINDNAILGFEYSLLRYIPDGKAKYRMYDKGELSEFTGKLYGILFVAFSRDDYEKFISDYDAPRFREYIFATNKNNYSRVIVAPEFNGNLPLANYDKIVFLSAPLNDGVISYLNKVTKAEILIPSKCSNKYHISIDSEIFAKYFEKIRANRTVSGANLFSYFNKINEDGDLSLIQFYFCLSVFEELNFITVNRTPFKITINDGVRSSLNSSQIYQAVAREVE